MAERRLPDEVVVRLQDHTPAASAVAAAGPALGYVSFAVKGHAAFAAVTGTGDDLDFVDEHLVSCAYS